MASNPIQRRARQSFLIGFLIALVIMAVVVALLFMKINKLNEEKEALKVRDITVYTLAQDIKSGDEVTSDMLVPTVVRAEIDNTMYMTNANFEYDEETGEPLKYFSKINIPTGTMLTPDMLYAEDDKTTDDERIVEYNMIVLPSQLKNGDYIDVRLMLPDGTDFIVLSKKRVNQCTTSAIWMNMSEYDMSLIENAVIDSYIVTGSKLYATIYKEPGMQEAATLTYVPTAACKELLKINPNVTTEAMQELINRWTTVSDSSGFDNGTILRGMIEKYSAEIDPDEKQSRVDSKVQEEITDITTMRDEYVTALDGTGVIGVQY